MTRQPRRRPRRRCRADETFVRVSANPHTLDMSIIFYYIMMELLRHTRMVRTRACKLLLYYLPISRCDRGDYAAYVFECMLVAGRVYVMGVLSCGYDGFAIITFPFCECVCVCMLSPAGFGFYGDKDVERVLSTLTDMNVFTGDTSNGTTALCQWYELHLASRHLTCCQITETNWCHICVICYMGYVNRCLNVNTCV